MGYPLLRGLAHSLAFAQARECGERWGKSWIRALVIVEGSPLGSLDGAAGSRSSPQAVDDGWRGALRCGTVPDMMRPRQRPADELVPTLRRDLVQQGYDDRTIGGLVRSKTLHRVRRGAYIDGSVWADLSPEDRHRVLTRAVLRTAHASTVLSHVSAAVELGAPTYDLDLTKVHVTRLDQHPGRKEAGVVHHVGSLRASEVIDRNGVRLTGGDRAAVEVTTTTDVEHALVVVNGLLRTGEATPEGIESFAHTAKHWPNSLRTDLVLRLADARVESVGESRTFYMFWKAGLPRPVPQLEIRDESGQVVARCDFALPNHGVFIEFDGLVKLKNLVPEGQSAVDVIVAQQRREELITRLTGWVCIRLTWADLQNPEATVRRIRAVLAGRPTRHVA